MPTFPLLVTDDASTSPVSSPPVATSSASYVICQSNSGSPDFNNVLTVFKSTDSGVTWNIQDFANGPLNDGNGTCYYILDSGGVFIWVVYVDNNIDLAIVKFDTGSDTWGNVLDTIAQPNPPIHTNLLLCAQNDNGDIITLGNFGLYDETVAIASTTASFIVYSGSWGGFIDFSVPGPVDPLVGASGCLLSGIQRAGDFVHCYMTYNSAGGPALGAALYNQSVSSSGSLGNLNLIGNSSLFQGELPGALSVRSCFDSSNDLISIVTIGLFGVSVSNVSLASATNSSDPIFGFTTFNPGLSPLRVNVPDIICTAPATTFLFLVNSSDDTPADLTLTLYINNVDQQTVGTWTTITQNLFYALATPFSLNGYVAQFAGSQLYWEQAGTPIPPTIIIQKVAGGGATYFPRFFNKTFLRESIARIYGVSSDPAIGEWITLREFPPLSSFFLFPNIFDLCLSREFQMYNLIDREAMSCARKPDCFLKSERDWQDSPLGWRTFNPTGAIPLPDPSTPDVVIFSFRVPYGYDGVVTAQYHGYTNSFTQGSGDLAFRVRADGRYLRDAGDMLVSIGNPKQLSPINGGLQLRSGNLVEYIVSAPNITGTLPPGGNILAGLHGLFYPRL